MSRRILLAGIEEFGIRAANRALASSSFLPSWLNVQSPSLLGIFWDKVSLVVDVRKAEVAGHRFCVAFLSIPQFCSWWLSSCWGWNSGQGLFLTKRAVCCVFVLPVGRQQESGQNCPADRLLSGVSGCGQDFAAGTRHCQPKGWRGGYSAALRSFWVQDLFLLSLRQDLKGCKRTYLGVNGLSVCRARGRSWGGRVFFFCLVRNWPVI